MEGTKELITTDAIRSKVYILRGQQVMLDQDLAEIYGYQVKNLNQQVKRNVTRFYVSTNERRSRIGEITICDFTEYKLF